MDKYFSNPRLIDAKFAELDRKIDELEKMIFWRDVAITAILVGSLMLTLFIIYPLD